MQTDSRLAKGPLDMKKMGMLRGASVGAGYFSQFHFEAWNRIAQVGVVALADRNRERARRAAEHYGVPHVYGADQLEAMFDEQEPDFVDIITPPETHCSVVERAASKGIAIICQKPLAPSFEESRAIVATAAKATIRTGFAMSYLFRVRSAWQGRGRPRH